MDVFEQARQEMDDFIQTIAGTDNHNYYLAITGRLFVPNLHTAPEDVEVFINTSLGFYEEIKQSTEYDVSHIIETLNLILKLNQHFR